MTRLTVPANVGKVRVVMGLGGKYTVWNGKTGRGEFVIICRNRKQAESVCQRINAHRGPEEFEVEVD